jgi:hypothetical protein
MMTNTDARSQVHVQLWSTLISLRVTGVQVFSYYLYYFRLIQIAKIQNPKFFIRAGNVTVNQKSTQIK